MATTDMRRASSNTLACLLTGGAGDEAALGEAVALRDAAGGRLAVLAALSTPLCVTLPEGGAWCPDLAEYEASMRAWLEERTTGLRVDEHVVLFDPAELALCEWARRAGIGTLIVARRESHVHRLWHRDTVAYLVRHAPCAVLVVADAAGPRSDRVAAPPRAGSHHVVRSPPIV